MMIEIGMGSVQSWEIDMMGHLNVQHYVARVTATLASLSLALGLGPRRSRAEAILLQPMEQHIRFHRELRAGAPFTIRGGVIGVEGDRLDLYQEMRHTLSGRIAATFRTQAACVDAASRVPLALPPDIAAAAERLTIALPEEGAPRGLALVPPRAEASWAEADRLGLFVTQEAPLIPAECDGDGFLEPRAVMGRATDGIPALLAKTRGSVRANDRNTGGAALEYRIAYRRPARAGDILAQRSGVSGLGGKTYSLVHWLMDRETGAAVATSESVQVLFDLTARKAIELDPALRSELEQHRVAGLTL
jgi:acyl-CoA thioester hydrolase